MTAVLDPIDLLERVHRALSAEVRFDHLLPPIELRFADGVLTLAGELPDISTKKLVLQRAAAIAGIEWISDQLTVRPAAPMTDAEIRAALSKLLLEEPTLRACTIAVSVRDGIVTLDGEVPSLSHMRLAGVLAWWVPGIRDVRNWLGVEPPEADNDDEITDAVRIVLAKDPFVDASEIGVRTKEGRVTLSGVVHSEPARRMAVHDAWYVLGVGEVIDELVVWPLAHP